MNVQIFKRVLACALAGVLTVGLAACSGGTADSAGDTAAPGDSVAASTGGDDSGGAAASSGDVREIKFFHRFPDEPFNGFIESVIADYEAANPGVKIVVTTAANDPYKEKLKVVMGSNERPDIMFSWVGDFTNRFVREGLLMDLTDLYENDAEWKDSMIDSMVEPFYTDGRLYGLPFRCDAKAFYYNVDIFDEQGLEVPNTWEEFIDVLEALKAAGITPLSYGNQEMWPSAHWMGTLNQKLVPNDVRLSDYDPANGDFTHAGYVSALEYYQSILPYCNDHVNGIMYEMSRRTFTSGQAAVYYGETIEIPNIEDEGGADFNYSFFPFPIIDGPGDQNMITGAPEGFIVAASATHPDETVDFLRYMTGPEVGKRQVKEIKWFNGAVGTVGSDDTQSLQDAYALLTEASGLAYWLDNDLHATVTNEYLTAVSDLTNGDVTPEQVMERIREAAQQAKLELGEEGEA